MLPKMFLTKLREGRVIGALACIAGGFVGKIYENLAASALANSASRAPTKNPLTTEAIGTLNVKMTFKYKSGLHKFKLQKFALIASSNFKASRYICDVLF